MTISESRNILRDKYIKWYTTASQMNNYRSLEDAEYSWWEREKEYGADWRPRLTEIFDNFFTQNVSF